MTDKSKTTDPAYEIARLKAENEFMRQMINTCSGSCCTPEDWPKRLAWWKANDPSKRHTIGANPMSDKSQTTKTATFYQHEIELLINRALAVRYPFVMRSWRWVRRSKKVAASDEALYRFHDIAAAALTRFDRSAESHG